MAEPTAAELKLYAKNGIAMPDESFYIRNVDDLDNAIKAVGRATPNAGESEVARRNSVRRHIIKRANALKRADMIPDTWASDGSLKQAVAAHEQRGEAFILEHFGRKGMHWGEHVFGRDPQAKIAKNMAKRTSLLNEASTHEAASAHHARLSLNYQAEAADVEKRGLQSTAFKRVYGDKAAQMGEWEFYGRNGQSKAQALRETHNNLRIVANQHASAANRHSKKATKLRTQAKGLEHSDQNQEVLTHFGRKGMKWGEHVFGRDRGSGTATVHPDVARARAAQATIRTHGLHALSNNELRDLNKRTQLETDYARLHSHTSEGRKIVEQIAKEQSKALATGYIQKYGPQGVSWLIKNGIKITVGAGKHKA